MNKKEALQILQDEYDCSSIKDYLEMLSDEMGVDYSTVRSLFDIYGIEEMFDGLVAAVEDVAMEMEN